jgi:hypothetical protein
MGPEQGEQQQQQQQQPNSAGVSVVFTIMSHTTTGADF